MNAVRSFRLLFRWQALQALPYLPVAILLQALVGGATVIGLALLIPDLDRVTALYLSTGGPTFALISLGIAVLPQVVVQSKTTGIYDYFETLPVPRLTYLVAEITVLLLVALPGMVAALLVAELRFGFHLHPTPAVVPVALLVVLTATAVGYVVAVTIKNPTLVTLVSNASLFVVMFFSPINYPVERLPTWLREIHRFLPFKSMADLMRTSLAGSAVPMGSLLLVVVWAVASLTVTFRAAGRRA